MTEDSLGLKVLESASMEPTPAAFAISGINEIRKHRKERGGFFKTILHTLTFGAFGKHRKAGV